MNGQSRDKGNIWNKTKKKTKTFVKNINKRKQSKNTRIEGVIATSKQFRF